MSVLVQTSGGAMLLGCFGSLQLDGWVRRSRAFCATALLRSRSLSRFSMLVLATRTPSRTPESSFKVIFEDPGCHFAKLDAPLLSAMLSGEVGKPLSASHVDTLSPLWRPRNDCRLNASAATIRALIDGM
jgi:hypothetical protein